MSLGIYELFLYVLYFALLALWIVGVVAAIRRLAREHAPVWAIVLLVIAMVVLPFVTVAAYWLVVAVRRSSGDGHGENAPPAGGGTAWAPPTVPSPLPPPQ